MPDSFPRRQARTRRFTLGAPRGLTVSPDGTRLVFLRSRGGTDAVTCLWTLDVGTGTERLVADPRALEAGSGPGSDDDLPPEERARRERAREQAGGIVAYAADRAATTAAFALSGRLHVADLRGADLNGADLNGVGSNGGPVRPLPSPGPVVDPRPDPTGARVAYVSGGALHVHDLASGAATVLVRPESDTVTYGLADFVAAEEMNRMRGYWWSPDGRALLVARVDDAPVRRWHIADPANPEREPTVVAYPAAGTPNATVSLALVRLDGTCTDVYWDVARDEYLAHVVWSDDRPLIVVQPRDQRALRVLQVDPATGATSLVHEDTDAQWVDIVAGVPASTASGAFVWASNRDGARRLLVDDEPVTPPSLQVRSVLDVDGDTVLIGASEDPTSTALWSWSAAAGLRCLTPEAGLHGGRLVGGTLVVIRQSLDADGTTTTVRPGVLTEQPPPRGVGSSDTRQGSSDTRGGPERTVTSLAEAPGLEPRVTLDAVGERALRTALLLPSWHTPGTSLPVLMDPYGGPHAQRVVAARGAHLTSQWFAEQGFAVVVVDGRGTPGRGPAFERAVWGDLAAPVLDDQVDALLALAADHPELDLRRVGIRGWSFGGYLAALAVLRRPDVFHAAVAGAPVTDWALYDTHYTERYLGRPDTHPEAYARTSLLPDAERLTRPLLLVHGLADDNVVAAHTLRLSSALLAAGRPHSVLPLSGVTHMTPQEVVAENLLLLQVEFLRDALGLRGVTAAPRGDARHAASPAPR